MADKLQTILTSLSDVEKQELLTALLREHFASAHEVEQEVLGAEGEIVGYLTPPGVWLCHLLGLNPKDMPRELAGPHYPGGHTLRMLEKMAAEAEAATPTHP